MCVCPYLIRSCWPKTAAEKKFAAETVAVDMAVAVAGCVRMAVLGGDQMEVVPHSFLVPAIARSSSALLSSSDLRSSEPSQSLPCQLQSFDIALDTLSNHDNNRCTFPPETCC